MRNRVLVIVLMAAVISGLLAAVSIDRYLSEVREGGKRQTVVVAKTEIPVGEKIAAHQLMTVKVPVNARPEGSFDAIEKVAGRVTTAKIGSREPVTITRLAPEGASAGLSGIIPEGYRAMTVKVDDAAGIAGFLMPGALVDVLALISQNDHSGQTPISKIVLQNIKVLANGQNLDQPNDGREPQTVKSVTLLVTPEQAEKLALSSFEGRLSLALRNTLDQEDQQTRGADRNMLLSSSPALAVPDPAEPETKQLAVATKNQSRTASQMMASIADDVDPAPAKQHERVSVDVYEGATKRTLAFQ
jgi:pilus assembly protein CpaB